MPQGLILSARRHLSVRSTAVGLFVMLAVLLTGMSTASAVKPAPHGIFVVLPAWNSERRVELNRPVLSNPLVRGARIRTVWRNLQPEENSLNWSFFDEAVSLAQRHGKSVGLSVAAGTFTPEWVYGNGAQRFDFTDARRFGSSRGTTMPEPWDEQFLKQWGETVKAMGRRYDGNPSVAYVVIGGLGISVESFFVKTPEDIAKFNSMGGGARWLEGAKRIVDLYAEAFPTTPFFYAMAPPIKGDFSATRALVEYGVSKYPGRFGIMHEGLNAVAKLSFYPNQAIQTYSSKAPTGFQMVWNTKGSEGAARVKGTLKQALTRAAEMNARFVEVYEMDCQDPAYAGDLREAGQRLGVGKTQPAQ
jgi:Beta-galactosidase